MGTTLWGTVEGAAGTAAHAVGVALGAILTSPDGGPAIGLMLLLVLGVALVGTWLVTPPRAAASVPAGRALGAGLDPGPPPAREVYRPPAPRSFPARAYIAAARSAWIGARPVAMGGGGLDETGLVPMVYARG